MKVVVQLESNLVTATCVSQASGRNSIKDRIEFDPDLSDRTGSSLFRSIDTRVCGLIEKAGEGASPNEIPVAIVMPGSLSPPHVVVRCSRLNIRQECDLRNILSPSSPKYTLVNDVIASAYGHIHFSLEDSLTEGWEEKLLLFVYVNEGVGSLFISNKRPLQGAGFAGPLGHAIVEPKGQYFDDFRARGALETYCSRPWMSANIVNRYYTEKDKSGDVLFDDNSTTSFSRALKHIELSQKHSLSFSLINDGIKSENALALSVLSEATDYLGLTLSHLLVATNPHLVVLDGNMIHQVEQFYERTVRSIRRYTWVDAWNATKIVKSQNTPDNAIFGALEAVQV